jgi:hypothetical protein
MNEPEDKMRASWSTHGDRHGGVDIAALQALAERREARMRNRDRTLYGSAAIIIPSWLATLYFMPDLRLLATSGLLIGVWLTWQQHRRSGMRLGGQAVDLPCAEFQRQLIKRELDLYAAMPKWFLAPVIAGQIVIILTLLTNPRFEKDGRFAVGLLMFVTTVVVALVMARKRWRREAHALEFEMAALGKGDES